jgi:hypothetical protein
MYRFLCGLLILFALSLPARAVDDEFSTIIKGFCTTSSVFNAADRHNTVECNELVISTMRNKQGITLPTIRFLFLNGKTFFALVVGLPKEKPADKIQYYPVRNFYTGNLKTKETTSNKADGNCSTSPTLDLAKELVCKVHVNAPDNSSLWIEIHYSITKNGDKI